MAVFSTNCVMLIVWQRGCYIYKQKVNDRQPLLIEQLIFLIAKTKFTTPSSAIWEWLAKYIEPKTDLSSQEKAVHLSCFSFPIGRFELDIWSVIFFRDFRDFSAILWWPPNKSWAFEVVKKFVFCSLETGNYFKLCQNNSYNSIIRPGWSTA